MGLRHQSPHTVRIVGALLATVWLGTGAAALVIGAVAQHWLLVFGGLGALWFGVVWVYVARQRRLLTTREALMPWRIAQRSDA